MATLNIVCSNVRFMLHNLDVYVDLLIACHLLFASFCEQVHVQSPKKHQNTSEPSGGHQGALPKGAITKPAINPEETDYEEVSGYLYTSHIYALYLTVYTYLMPQQ